jgi:nicotinamidase-related amidase
MPLYNSSDELASLVEPSRTAVIVVDVQRRFTSRPKWPALDEVLPRMQRFIGEAKRAGALIVHIQAVQNDEQYTENWQRQLPASNRENAAPGSEPSQFHPGFEPEPDDLHFTKPRYSSFVGTDLESKLRQRGIRTVVVLGLTTDVCVSSTARDAFQLDFQTITLGDCTAEATQARHDSGLATLAANFGAVASSDEIIAAWNPSAVPIASAGVRI